MTFLERRFALSARGTTAAREGLAGLTSFLAAAYLIVVIPSLLASGGMDGLDAPDRFEAPKPRFSMRDARSIPYGGQCPPA